MNYPHWSNETKPGDRVAFDLGYSYALLQRAAGLLESLGSSEAEQLLAIMHEFEQQRLAVRSEIYQGAYELGAQQIGK